MTKEYNQQSHTPKADGNENKNKALNPHKPAESFDMVTGDLSQNMLQTDIDIFPKINISETDKEVKITAEMPGIQPEDVRIDAHDKWIAIAGVMDREKVSADGYEEMHGEFRREFSLPSKVREDRMKASHENGVLNITFPKAE